MRLWTSFYGIGPNEWFYWMVVVLVGSCHTGELSWRVVLGIVVVVGNSLALFFYLVGNCPQCRELS